MDEKTLNKDLRQPKGNLLSSFLNVFKKDRK